MLLENTNSVVGRKPKRGEWLLASVQISWHTFSDVNRVVEVAIGRPIASTLPLAVIQWNSGGGQRTFNPLARHLSIGDENLTIYVVDVPPRTVIETIEDVKKAIDEACAHYLFEPNNEINAHRMKNDIMTLVRETYDAGFKIADSDGDLIENFEDVDVVVDMGSETNVYLVPTEGYWAKKMERRIGNLEGIKSFIQADDPVELPEPAVRYCPYCGRDG